MTNPNEQHNNMQDMFALQNNAGLSQRQRRRRDLPVIGRVLRWKDTVKRLYSLWRVKRQAETMFNELEDADYPGGVGDGG